jgi:hypothetical protein
MQVSASDIPNEVTVAIAEDTRLRAESEERRRVESLSIDVEVLVDDALFDAYRLRNMPNEVDEPLSSSSSSSAAAAPSAATPCGESLEPAAVVNAATRRLWQGIPNEKFNPIKV